MEPSQTPEVGSQVSLHETRSWYRYAHTNPLIAYRSASRFRPAPPLSSDAEQLHLTYGNNYAANFDVKYLGSGLVLHHTDFGGCQTLLNERKRRRQRRKYTRIFGITITPESFFAVDRLTGVRELTRDLENVYVLHPHPTQTRLFGIITENFFSGTFYCYCYLTKRGSTGVDVLQAFRKACYLWLSNSNHEQSQPLTLTKQSLTPASSEFAILDGIPENYIYGEPSGGDLRVRHGSEAMGRPKRTHSQAKEGSSLQGVIEHPSQQEGTEQPSPKNGVEQPAPTASRQVSFAPVAKVNCYQLPGAKCVDIPLEQSISQSPIYAKVTSSCGTQKPQFKRNVPCLPQRKFPPPAPPQLPSIQPPCPPPAPPLPVIKPPVLRTKSHPLPSQEPHPPSPRVEPLYPQPPRPPPSPPLPVIKPPVLRIQSYPLPSWKPHPPSQPISPPPAPRIGLHTVEPYTTPVGLRQPARVELFATPPSVKPYLSPAQEAPHTPPRAPSVRLPLFSAECIVPSQPEETDCRPPTPPPRTCSLRKSHKLGMLGVY